MVNVVIYFQKNKILGFNVKGHAGFADYGKDIVCSAITSCVMMSCNAITEILHQPCNLKVENGEIELLLKEDFFEGSFLILNALYQQLNLLAENYSENLIIKIVEV